MRCGPGQVAGPRGLLGPCKVEGEADGPGGKRRASWAAVREKGRGVGPREENDLPHLIKGDLRTLE